MAIPFRAPGRAIPQIFKDVEKGDLNEVFRRLSELASMVEGRRGPILFKDSGEFASAARNTLLKLQGNGDRASGSISLSGDSINSALYLAKGAYQNDTGGWIATDSEPIILGLVGGSNVPLLYRDTNIAIGAEFSPTPQYDIFSKSATLYAEAGLTAGAIVPTWLAPTSCEILSFKAIRVGGAGATVNGTVNGVDSLLSSDLSLTTTSWTDGGAIAFPTLSQGDSLELLLVSAAGAPTQITIQIDLRRT